MNDQLSQSESRYRALVTATSDVVYRMSPDWRVLHQLESSGFLDDTGVAIDDWMDKYVYSGDRERVQEAILHAIKTKTMFHLEHRVQGADGSIGWTFSRAVPILDEQGNITEWFGAANDVSARRQTEEDLKRAKDLAEQQKRLYEAVTSSTPDLIYVFDLNYRFTYANKALLTMWGKSWGEAVGKGLLENGYEPWHAEMHEREIDTVAATKQSIRGEVSFPHATLGRRVYDYIFTPVLNEQDEVIAVAGTTRDITDIRNAEITLAESESRFRNMAEGTNIYIAMSDENGHAIYFNEAWRKLTGKPTEELSGYQWALLLHPDDRARYLGTFQQAIDNRTPTHDSFRLLTRDGQYRWLLIDGSIRLYNDGSFAGYISAGIDITDLKEDEQRKNDFINIVSHELKTPLTSAMAYVQVSKAKSSELKDELTGVMLSRTEQQLRKMSTMINGFLNVSRLESGKILIEKQRFNMAELMKEIEEETVPLNPSHHIVFETVPGLWVNADRDKIGQVVSNLISNAIKYSKAGSTIQIACAGRDGAMVCSVADEGIGISKEDAERVFERYYRIDTGTPVSGFGIGLYLSYEILQRHGGKIYVDSEPGKGSTFYFALLLDETPSIGQTL